MAISSISRLFVSGLSVQFFLINGIVCPGTPVDGHGEIAQPPAPPPLDPHAPASPRADPGVDRRKNKPFSYKQDRLSYKQDRLVPNNSPGRLTMYDVLESIQNTDYLASPKQADTEMDRIREEWLSSYQYHPNDENSPEDPITGKEWKAYTITRKHSPGEKLFSITLPADGAYAIIHNPQDIFLQEYEDAEKHMPLGKQVSGLWYTIEENMPRFQWIYIEPEFLTRQIKNHMNTFLSGISWRFRGNGEELEEANGQQPTLLGSNLDALKELIPAVKQVCNRFTVNEAVIPLKKLREGEFELGSIQLDIWQKGQ